MKTFNVFMEGVTKVTNGALVVLMTAMSGMIIAQIITRYIAGSTPAFVNELATYCLIWIAFFGSSIAIRWNKHVAVDIVLTRLSEEKAKKLTSIIHIVVLVFLSILFLATLNFAISQWGQYSATMGIRITWPVAGSVIGTFLMILQMIDTMISPQSNHVEEGVIS
ncbi:TRAP transporter small permease [bacterium LRH843]|nr:TRAP transporter small permease [bacterium LRH843]